VTIATVFSTERALGRLALGARDYRAALGAAGVRTHKEEGDQATPAGLMPLRRVLYRADRVKIRHAAVPREPIGPADGWCDDPAHRDYNRAVRLPHDGRCEALWRRDAIYDVVGVLGWNDDPIVRGRGSAIFLHVARADFGATEGCVALALPDLLEILAAGLTGIDVQA
jgi:L,D-peptidoglycan transpeptidase YkuD (ErfK/YbiS/YcfS/YnhG family)